MNSAILTALFRPSKGSHRPSWVWCGWLLRLQWRRRFCRRCCNGLCKIIPMSESICATWIQPQWPMSLSMIAPISGLPAFLRCRGLNAKNCFRMPLAWFAVPIIRLAKIGTILVGQICRGLILLPTVCALRSLMRRFSRFWKRRA